MNKKDTKKILIIGAGSWGTAIALHVSSFCPHVILYSRDKEQALKINAVRYNHNYLPEILLPDNITVTSDLGLHLDADLIIIATPSSALLDMIDNLTSLGLKRESVVVIATKGMSRTPLQLFSDLLPSKMPNPFAFLSGPNFASEIGKGLYASATIASSDGELANSIAALLTTSNFEFCPCDDVITVQIAGIVKNIIAIQSGILIAQDAGENARASLITQGLAEIVLISSLFGGRMETVLQPAVIGDLVLTASSTKSRNTKFGYMLHSNNYSNDLLDKNTVLLEGVLATNLITELIKPYKLKLPIIDGVRSILAGLVKTIANS
jgi:glycerol-3-phosphate dehydrogenase (NAD(P)+)